MSWSIEKLSAAFPWIPWKIHIFNGNFKILKWSYVNVPYFWPYEFWGYPLKNRPNIYRPNICGIGTSNQSVSASWLLIYDHPMIHGVRAERSAWIGEFSLVSVCSAIPGDSFAKWASLIIWSKIRAKPWFFSGSFGEPFFSFLGRVDVKTWDLGIYPNNSWASYRTTIVQLSHSKKSSHYESIHKWNWNWSYTIVSHPNRTII